MTPIRDLELFKHLVATGSMSEAGRELGVSPAVVSKRLTALEASLGARLFYRPVSRLELTASGRALHNRVTAMLADLKHASPIMTTIPVNDNDVRSTRRVH
jgi:DNA-binding transcriptional LysR family regulator